MTTCIGVERLATGVALVAAVGCTPAPPSDEALIGTWKREAGVPAIVWFYPSGDLALQSFGRVPGHWSWDGEQLCISLQDDPAECGQITLRGSGVGAEMQFLRETGPPSAYRRIASEPDTLCWVFDPHDPEVALRADDPACADTH